MLCEALDAVGLAGYRVGLGDAALYPALLERPRGRRRSTASACCRSSRPRLRRPRARGARARPRAPSDADAARARAAAARRGRGARRAARAGRPTRCAGCATSSTCSRTRVAERVIFDLGLARGLGYYTGAVFDVYDPALGEPLGGGGRYDDLLGRFGRALPAVGLRASASTGCTCALAGGGAGEPLRADHRGAARRAARRDARRARALGIDTSRGARQRPQAALRATSGIVTMRPSDVPTYVEAGAADIGITGKDVLMEQSERAGLRAARPRLRAAARWCSPPSPASPTRPPRRCAAWASCASRRSTRASAARYFEETGRQAEIVEVKGSVELAPLTGLVEAIVDLTATGHDAARERPRRPRGDRHLDRAADRQPGRPQAQGGRDRRDRGGAAWRLSASRSATRPQVAAARPGAGARRRVGGRRGGRASSATCARAATPR